MFIIFIQRAKKAEHTDTCITNLFFAFQRCGQLGDERRLHICL